MLPTLHAARYATLCMLYVCQQQMKIWAGNAGMQSVSLQPSTTVALELLA
jgi:hypothetical protein